jgi:hypothetical protein
MTGVDEIHLPFRVDDNRRAWMRDRRAGSNDQEADEGERQEPIRHTPPLWPGHVVAKRGFGG